MTEGVIWEKSTWKRKRRPSAAPGSVKARMTHIMRSTKSAGIIILIAFSIPLETPREMIAPMTQRTNTCQKIGESTAAEKKLPPAVPAPMALPNIAPAFSAVMPTKAPVAALNV